MRIEKYFYSFLFKKIIKKSCKVLQALKGTENEWLIDLLFAFNSGDVAKFRYIHTLTQNTKEETVFNKNVGT